MEVPFSNANRIRLIEAPTLSRWISSSSGWDSLQGVPPPPPASLQRMGFASRGSPSLSQSEWDSHQEGHPLQSEWDSLLTTGLVAARDPFQGILLLQGHANQGIPSLQRASPLHLSEWDSLREILLLPNDNVLSRGTQILLDGSIHPELRLVRLQLRDPSRGLLPPILIHLHKKIRKLKTPLCQPQLRPWLILFFRVSLKQQRRLPILHLDLLIFLPLQASQTLQLPRDRFWPGAMPCQMPFLTLKRRESLQFAYSGKRIKANPNILDLLRNKVPDFRYLPISIKEGITIERSLRSCLESHNFLTWSVMALIHSLHKKKLLPKDDPVISQLQKSLSKVCGSVASASSSNAPFVTLKRRQFVCGVCLLCDSCLVLI